MSKDPQRYADLESLLLNFKEFPLLGIQDPQRLSVFIEQIIESERRIKYVHIIRNKNYSSEVKNPYSDGFNPLKAASCYSEQDNFNEAIWLIFLSTHFGKHGINGWNSIQHIYGGLGQKLWTWDEVSKDPTSFSKWIDNNLDEIKRLCRFGNHRKYESHKAIGDVVSSYIDSGCHDFLVQQARLSHRVNYQDPYKAFAQLYSTIEIFRFGRTAKFDFLSMLGNIGVVNIIADSTYLINATGPYSGAKLLLGNISRKEAESKLIELDSHLNIGMQVLEDSLCNWQKSPDKLVRFRG